MRSKSRGAQSTILLHEWYAFIGIGMGLIRLIIFMIIAYIVYNLIKNEKILALSKSAENILAKRGAKGELTREQYMQIKEDLKKSSKVYCNMIMGSYHVSLNVIMEAGKSDTIAFLTYPISKPLTYAPFPLI